MFTEPNYENTDYAADLDRRLDELFLMKIKTRFWQFRKRKKIQAEYDYLMACYPSGDTTIESSLPRLDEFMVGDEVAAYFESRAFQGKVTHISPRALGLQFVTVEVHTEEYQKLDETFFLDLPYYEWYHCDEYGMSLDS